MWRTDRMHLYDYILIILLMQIINNGVKSMPDSYLNKLCCEDYHGESDSVSHLGTHTGGKRRVYTCL